MRTKKDDYVMFRTLAIKLPMSTWNPSYVKLPFSCFLMENNGGFCKEGKFSFLSFAVWQLIPSSTLTSLADKRRWDPLNSCKSWAVVSAMIAERSRHSRHADWLNVRCGQCILNKTASSRLFFSQKTCWHIMGTQLNIHTYTFMLLIHRLQLSTTFNY